MWRPRTQRDTHTRQNGAFPDDVCDDHTLPKSVFPPNLALMPYFGYSPEKESVARGVSVSVWPRIPWCPVDLHCPFFMCVCVSVCVGAPMNVSENASTHVCIHVCVCECVGEQEKVRQGLCAIFWLGAVRMIPQFVVLHWGGLVLWSAQEGLGVEGTPINELVRFLVEVVTHTCTHTHTHTQTPPPLLVDARCACGGP